ncbi:hypothetical protein MTR67_035487 [Solanum verrucosum]|uniref:Uncharacterized protein n=1 Tax=Solanum verrucosum TaxID=315347 RepID=A0AAF0UA04_SOLVR|nr:hypothetical protein MTR67_035487 [Solanum verrucosum]
MQISRSYRCNPRLPSTDRMVTHDQCWWSVVRICNLTQTQPRKYSKCRPTTRPTNLRSGHGPWFVSVDRPPIFQLSNMIHS